MKNENLIGINITNKKKDLLICAKQELCKYKSEQVNLEMKEKKIYDELNREVKASTFLTTTLFTFDFLTILTIAESSSVFSTIPEFLFLSLLISRYIAQYDKMQYHGNEISKIRLCIDETDEKIRKLNLEISKIDK